MILAECSWMLHLGCSDKEQRCIATRVRAVSLAHEICTGETKIELSASLVNEIAEDNRLKRSMSGASAAFDSLPAIPSADGGGAN